MTYECDEETYPFVTERRGCDVLTVGYYHQPPPDAVAGEGLLWFETPIWVSRNPHTDLSVIAFKSSLPSEYNVVYAYDPRKGRDHDERLPEFAVHSRPRGISFLVENRVALAQLREALKLALGTTENYSAYAWRSLNQ